MLSKFLKLFKRKSVIISILFAIGLWLYTSFNSSYKYYIVVPFNIIMPFNRAIENELPKTITLRVQGTGWNLLNLNYLNNSKKVVVDWTNKTINDSSIVISRNELLKGIQSMEGISIEEFSPEIINVITGKIISKKVPVIHQISITPNEYFTLSGNITLLPDSVEISGNEKLISNINNWQTVPLNITDITRPYRSTIDLSDSLQNIIKLSRDNVDFYADIQQTAEIIIPDVKIETKGGDLPKDSYFSPPRVNIIIQAGIKELEKISKDKIVCNIDINSILHDSTGIVVPNIIVPEGYKVLKVEPAFIKHFKLEKITSIKQIK